MRKKVIIANWKMNLTLALVQDFAFKLKSELGTKTKQIDIAICPPNVYLLTLSNILKENNKKIYIGAQNIFYKEEGAYTGEISGKMLKDLHIDMVIVGHSERRQYFNETDEIINLKIKAAIKNELIPIFCVGEDLKTREKGLAEKHVQEQVLAGIKDLSNTDIVKLIIAYEPIWAIGTGKICSGEDANKIIKTIRKIIKEKSTTTISENLRILYGGSIKSDNFSDHIQYSDIDGGLVGGASLSFEEFMKIVDLAKKSNLGTPHGASLP